MTIRNLVEKSSQALLDLVLPPYCLNCKAAGGWLCQDCLAAIPVITGPLCPRCGAAISAGAPAAACRQCRHHPLQAIDGIRAAAYFEDNPVREAIHFLKYQNHQAVAALLGQLLAEAYRRDRLAADVLVPVPLHPARFRERGYNQSELLARAAGRQLGLPVETRTLRRTRQTQAQMSLGAGERHQNVAGAFNCATDDLRGRRVLLIDDVCTTGSTLDACAAALKERYIASVWGLTLARAR